MASTGLGRTFSALIIYYLLASPCHMHPPPQLDNHGRRLLLSEEASLNIPAVAAAHVVKRYTAQAPDELSFEVRLWEAGKTPSGLPSSGHFWPSLTSSAHS